MKKFYAIIAAALMSVSVFTAKADVPAAPSDAVLGYTPGNVGVCIYVPSSLNCNRDIVFVGTYNNWGKGEGTVEDAKNCQKFEAVEGYEGWYYVEVEDASESPEGKPVMLTAKGAFSWDYQIGEATKVRGGVTIVEGGVKGEIDLKTYGKDVVNVYTVDGWKNDPCAAVYHNYTVTVVNNLGCGGFAAPFIIGAFNSWHFAQMQIDADKSAVKGAPCYTYSFEAAEGSGYQIVSGLLDTDGVTIKDQPGWNEASYLYEKVEDDWVRINNGQDFAFDDNVNVEYDWSDLTKFQWGRCQERVAHTYTITAQLPTVDAPAQVEVRGGWRDEDKEQGIKSSWDEGAVMTPGNTPGLWTVTIDAYEGCQFKFCSHAMGWAKQIQVYDSEGDTWKDLDNQKFGKDDAVDINFSDPDSYQWTPGEEQGIEDIVLTEKAQKVMVDGVLYIVRDNKMFNVQGAQVR